MAQGGLARLGRPCVVALALGTVLSTPAHGRLVARKATGTKRITRASWYGADFQGRRTASGRTFDQYHLTAAHRTISLGSKVKVTELRTGRSVVVQITDRGPYSPGRDIDLSYAAARQLGILRRGVAQVRLELIEHEPPVSKAPIVTACTWPTTSWLSPAIVE